MYKGGFLLFLYVALEEAMLYEHTCTRGHYAYEEDGEAVDESVDILLFPFEETGDCFPGESIGLPYLICSPTSAA